MSQSEVLGWFYNPNTTPKDKERVVVCLHGTGQECYERTEVHCVGWTSLPVSEGTEGNSLRFAKRIALANELERDKESSWDLTSQNARVVAK